MSVATIGLRCPTVFEADLPTVAYEEASSPDEAHRNLRKALEQGPIAMGAHGPEILSYELVRTTLRDHQVLPAPRTRPRGTGHHVGTIVGSRGHHSAQHQR